MNPKRRTAALAGAGAAIAASSSVLMRGVGDFAGLSGDFWRGVPVGLGLGLGLLAIVTLARTRSDKTFR